MTVPTTVITVTNTEIAKPRGKFVSRQASTKPSRLSGDGSENISATAPKKDRSSGPGPAAKKGGKENKGVSCCEITRDPQKENWGLEGNVQYPMFNGMEARQMVK